MRRSIASLVVAASIIGGVARAAGTERSDAVSQAVAAWLRPHVKILSRPVYTYHYAMRTRIGLPPSGPPPAAFQPSAYIDAKIPRYWDLSLPTHPFSTASGLYLATDPVIARGFGGSGVVWSMLEIVLGSGFRFIDVRGPGGASPEGHKFPSSLRALLLASGCDVKFPQTLLVAHESADCRSVAVKVARALQVDGILYEFPSKRFEPCQDRPAAGFIVLTRQSIASSGVRVFVQESRSADRAHIQDLFARARQAGSRLPLPWSDLPSAPDTGSTAWLGEHIFGCGAYPEDALAATDAASSAASLYDAARALAAGGRTAEAIDSYRAVLAVDPDEVRALDELAWLFATGPDPTLRNPAEAEILATHLVDLTHYKFRRSTGGMYAKLFKIHASHTLAAAFAANGKLSRAVDYARQSIETVQRLIEVDPSSDADQLLRDGRRYLELYSSGRPFIAPPGFHRADVPLH